MARVALGGVEVDVLRLGPQPEPLPDDLRDLVLRTDREGWGEDFHASGAWRLLTRDDDRAEVGAPSDTWGGWVLVHLERRASGWEVRGTSYGLEPGPTLEERSRGLRLEWPQDPLEVRRGRPWDLRVRLVNGRDEPVRDVVSPFAFGHLEDGAGRLPTVGEFGVTDQGMDLDLQPGEHAELAVLLLTEAPERLPAGEYRLVVSARSYDLHGEVGLRVR